MQKTKIKRILFDTTESFYKEVKAKAIIAGVSLKTYVTMAILEKIKRDNEYQ